MKKLFCLILAIVGFSFLNAQVSVPTATKLAFKDAYKSTTVVWTESTQYFIAKWDDNSKHKTAFYSKDATTATLIRMETEVSLSELSQSTQSMVNDKFLTKGSQYTLNRSFKVENSTDAVEGVEFNMAGGTNKISIFFDAAGSMVKRELAQ